MESILNSAKKKLGIEKDYTHFDDGELIDHINTVFMDLRRLGVGPSNGFIIEDADATWDDFLKDPLKLQGVKTYMHLRLRLIFDPPTSSAVITSYQQQIDKFEWCLNSEAELMDKSTT